MEKLWFSQWEKTRLLFDDFSKTHHPTNNKTKNQQLKTNISLQSISKIMFATATSFYPHSTTPNLNITSESVDHFKKHPSLLKTQSHITPITL